MSSDAKALTDSTKATAVDQYRAAFERLKADVPERLTRGSLVSQNNVAKEAGSDPSALKKSRFPFLIDEIKQYVEEQAQNRSPSVRQVRLKARAKNRDLRVRIEELIQQRDHLASLLSEADATILELYDRITELERDLPPSNILPIDPRGRKKL